VYCPFNFISRQSSNQKEPGNEVGKAGLKDNGKKKFIVYIKSVTSSNYEYDINTVSNIFVQELYACYFTVDC
jgi:hypothetical protein